MFNVLFGLPSFATHSNFSLKANAGSGWDWELCWRKEMSFEELVEILSAILFATFTFVVLLAFSVVSTVSTLDFICH